MSLRFNARLNTIISDGSPVIVIDGGSVEADVGLTANSNSSQGDSPITSSYNVYSTVVTTGDAATLPAIFAVGHIVYIKNDGAESMDVFPASGDDAGAGAETAVAIPNGESKTFIATAADATWTELIVGGAGGSGTVTSSGTPLSNEIAVFTSGTDIDSDSTLTWDGASLTIGDGVLFIKEQSAADTDVATFGQIWIRDEGFTQTLMFTADNGNDIELAAINMTDMNTGAINIPSVSMVECLTCQPDINQDYMVTAVFEVNAPSADDIDVEMVIDTGAVFKGVLQYSNQDGSVTGSFALDSGTGEVITNIVTVPTEGNTTPEGTYVTITGCLRMGATSGTHSVRVAKNADAGGDGKFEATSALQLLVLQIS